MKKEQTLGYDQALKITLETISPLGSGGEVILAEAVNRVLFKDLYSRVNSPSIDASMKDGYAVISEEIRYAAPQFPVHLKLTGTAAAGATVNIRVDPGCAVRILTGAGIPEGATAVLAEEFAIRENDGIRVVNDAEPGRNILLTGTDVKAGEQVAEKGSSLTPGLIGTIAAAGFGRVPVFRRPKVAILATGDELVIPGDPLPDGKLYASNLEMLKAWCLRFGMPTSFYLLNDTFEIITRTIETAVETHDAVITSGGAWTGERDFVGKTLHGLGWKKIFHAIRMGPGKAVGFGMLNKKPVFMLPGGPPSNLTAFLQIALPGLLRLAGHSDPGLPRIKVKLQESLNGGHVDWTEFIYGHLSPGEDHTLFSPLKLTRRLHSMASAQGAVAMPEGVTSLPEGSMITAQFFL